MSVAGRHDVLERVSGCLLKAGRDTILAWLPVDFECMRAVRPPFKMLDSSTPWQRAPFRGFKTVQKLNLLTLDSVRRLRSWLLHFMCFVKATASFLGFVPQLLRAEKGV